jgi:hypothetical protein
MSVNIDIFRGCRGVHPLCILVHPVAGGCRQDAAKGCRQEGYKQRAYREKCNRMQKNTQTGPYILINIYIFFYIYL